MNHTSYEVRVYENGDKYWYRGGKLHREDGPACVYANGDKEWWVEGKPHREDGPACVYQNAEFWYVNGVMLQAEEIELRRSQIKSVVNRYIEIHRCDETVDSDYMAVVWEETNGAKCVVDVVTDDTKTHLIEHMKKMYPGVEILTPDEEN